MRVKFFLALLAVVVVVLCSNILFERLISKDFDAYITGSQEDKLYWIIASIEGSYEKGNGKWDLHDLMNVAHWGFMLGFEIEVKDIKGKTLITTAEAIKHQPPAMRQKMAAISMDAPVSTFDPYPLYYGGREIGTLYARQKKNSLLIEKEQTFKKRGKDFLLFSLLITGGSALLLSFLLASYLNRPLRKLSKAASEIATGNLNIRVKPTSADEIGKLSMTFNRMAEALERQEGLRKRLASNIAHELRTPLSIIKGHLEAILDGVMPAEAAQVESLLLEIDKLKKLIDGIEDIASLEAHSLYLEEREVELGSFLKDIAKSMEPLFKAKGITFNFERTSDVSMVTDPDKLSHILFNLLNNALKYTDSGSVTLSYGLRPEGLFIAVADTGVGIREEEVPFIFERFYKGIKSEGIGLGLAIAKELAGAIGGNLEVKSRVGEGSVFTLRIGRI